MYLLAARPLVALKCLFLFQISSLRNKYLCCVQVSTKSEKIFEIFNFIVISLGRVVVHSPKIIINLSGTYKQLPCKGEHVVRWSVMLLRILNIRTGKVEDDTFIKV